MVGRQILALVIGVRLPVPENWILLIKVRAPSIKVLRHLN